MLVVVKFGVIMLLIKEVEILYIKCLKYIHKDTCKDIVYGKLGVHHVHNIIRTRMITYWTRQVIGKQSKLACVMYRSLLYLNSVGLHTSDWFREVETILNNSDMSGMWLSIWLKKSVEQNPKDQWITVWLGSVGRICMQCLYDL